MPPTLIPDIPQGTEAKFTITIANRQGTPIDLTTLDHGYVVWIYNEPGNVVKKFSSTILANHSLVTVIDAVNGKFQILINRTLTASLTPNVYSYEIKTEMTDGLITFMPGKTAIQLFRIVVGQAKTLLTIS